MVKGWMGTLGVVYYKCFFFCDGVDECINGRIILCLIKIDFTVSAVFRLRRFSLLHTSSQLQ
jgi:hypothetical protein